MQTIYLCVLIHIWIKGEVGAPLNRFKPSSKIFYWSFQGGTSLVDLLCLCSVLCLLCLCACLCICALWSPAGKGLTSWLSFVVSTVSLSLSHWYSGSGVVLDCIDSWSLHPYLHWTWCDIDLRIPLLTSATPWSILVLSGRYHTMSNASIVNNGIIITSQQQEGPRALGLSPENDCL